MIKLCRKSIAYPLILIFEASLLGGKFPECLKRANVVLAHKKVSKKLVKNYRLISLLPIFGNINYLDERYQTVAFNGQTSSWELIKSEVPQGSVLGPLMFLIYINGLPDSIQTTFC